MIDGPNIYLYSGNDPINMVDLWGLCGEQATNLNLLQKWLNKRLGIDITNKYFSAAHYWTTYLNSAIESNKGLLVGAITTIYAPFPFDLIAGSLTFMASSQLSIDAYRQAWISTNPENYSLDQSFYYEDAGSYYKNLTTINK